MWRGKLPWPRNMFSQHTVFNVFSLTFIMYDCGAMTLETSARPARPYCAAPRNVAVSQSEGREMTGMCEENRSCDGNDSHRLCPSSSAHILATGRFTAARTSNVSPGASQSTIESFPNVYAIDVDDEGVRKLVRIPPPRLRDMASLGRG